MNRGVAEVAERALRSSPGLAMKGTADGVDFVDEMQGIVPGE